MNSLLKRCLAIIAIVLIGSVAITAIGGKFSQEDSNKFADVSEERGNRDATKNLIGVEFTLPAEYIGDASQDELDDAVKEHGFVSITLNEDGTAKFVLLSSRHRALVDQLRDEIRDSLKSMIGSSSCPNITDTKINKEFNEIIITTKSTELDDAERAIVSEISDDIKLYNYISGDGIEQVHFEFVNSDSNEVIEAIDSYKFSE